MRSCNFLILLVGKCKVAFGSLVNLVSAITYGGSCILSAFLFGFFGLINNLNSSSLNFLTLFTFSITIEFSLSFLGDPTYNNCSIKLNFSLFVMLSSFSFSYNLFLSIYSPILLNNPSNVGGVFTVSSFFGL